MSYINWRIDDIMTDLEEKQNECSEELEKLDKESRGGGRSKKRKTYSIRVPRKMANAVREVVKFMRQIGADRPNIYVYDECASISCNANESYISIDINRSGECKAFEFYIENPLCRLSRTKRYDYPPS